MPEEVPKVSEAEITFDFYQALKVASSGGLITKLEWSNPLIYGLMVDGKLMLHKEDGRVYDWIISDGDLDGLDWTVTIFPTQPV